MPFGWSIGPISFLVPAWRRTFLICAGSLSDGACTSVPSPGPIPPAARVFSYPCVERFGLVWAFNGEEPLFPPPEVRDFGPDDLLVHARETNVFEVAPWLSIGNTFDGRLERFHIKRMFMSWGIGLRSNTSREVSLDMLLAFGTSRFDADDFAVDNVRVVFGINQGF